MDRRLNTTTDFAGFAAATLSAAGADAGAVEEAWAGVGVVPGGRPVRAPAPELVAASTLVVRRSGGFVGLTTEAQRDLTGDDPVTVEARDLLSRVDLGATPGGDPMPDMYVYTFELPGRPPVRVPQQHLTPELRATRGWCSASVAEGPCRRGCPSVPRLRVTG